MKGIGVGVIGLGTVGAGVVKLLTTLREPLATRLGFTPELVRACDVRAQRGAELGLRAEQFTTSVAELLGTPGLEVVVELIGGIEPARTIMLTALRAGKHVVTANKALLALHGAELFATAQEMGVSLRCDASVAGGIPILNVLDGCLTANHVPSLYGIINGTTNFILTRMTEGNDTLARALADAQRLGFAEANPTLDLNGHDAAHKLTVLAMLMYGQQVAFDAVYCEGIEEISPTDIRHAAELGYALKLLAVAKCVPGDQPRLELRVHPTLVPAESPLASVRREYNAIFLTGDAVGNQMFYGKGAGELPTASAVMADILLIGRQLTPARTFYRSRPYPVTPMPEVTCQYYLRFSTVDQPGVLGTLCTTLSRHGISILSCMQKEHQETRDYVHIVIMTHAAREGSVRAALAEIDQLELVRHPARLLRIERV